VRFTEDIDEYTSSSASLDVYFKKSNNNDNNNPESSISKIKLILQFLIWHKKILV